MTLHRTDILPDPPLPANQTSLHHWQTNQNFPVWMDHHLVHYVVHHLVHSAGKLIKVLSLGIHTDSNETA
jgi:hypothetical protein